MRHKVLLWVVEEAAGAPAAGCRETWLVHHFKAARHQQHAQEYLRVVVYSIEAGAAQLRLVVGLLVRGMILVARHGDLVDDADGSAVCAGCQMQLICEILFILFQINVLLVVGSGSRELK